MGESIIQKIIRKTGRKPSVCKCEACRNQCRTPCLGTPEDVLQLIKAGYRDKLSISYWFVGVVLGRMKYPIAMVQAIKTEEGWCIFHQDGLCELHDEGLKPTEGRLSHHSVTKENYNFSKGLTYNVAKEWLAEENMPVVEEVFGYFKDG